MWPNAHLFPRRTGQVAMTAERTALAVMLLVQFLPATRLSHNAPRTGHRRW